MFIAVNTIDIPTSEPMAELFRQEAPSLQEMKGFIGYEIWTDGQLIKAISRWEDKAAFQTYLESEQFKHAHHGIIGEEKRNQGLMEYYESESLA